MSRLFAALMIILPPAVALAASTEDNTPSTYGGAGVSPAYAEAANLVEQGRYADAIPKLRTVGAAEPQNADAFNLLGFALRKTEDYEGSSEAYKTALTINPRHLDALEYQGELYLALGDIEKAEANLAQISSQCLFVCKQERQLEPAIKSWREANGS
ncbi:MAG: tetratricopeptide repeat protein [Pseudomonadota bacterium]